jgi:hypothetical protein
MLSINQLFGLSTKQSATIQPSNITTDGFTIRVSDAECRTVIDKKKKDFRDISTGESYAASSHDRTRKDRNSPG